MAPACESCTSAADKACNTPKVTGEDFKCKSWEWKVDKFVVKETSTICKRLKDTPTKCHR